MNPVFNTSRCEYSKVHIWYKFGDSNSYPLQVILHTQATFPILSNYIGPLIAKFIAPIWGPSGADKITAVMAEGGTDSRRQRQYPIGLKGLRIKIYFCLRVWYPTRRPQQRWVVRLDMIACSTSQTVSLIWYNETPAICRASRSVKQSINKRSRTGQTSVTANESPSLTLYATTSNNRRHDTALW